jgi:hypothetical protein
MRDAAERGGRAGEHVGQHGRERPEMSGRDAENTGGAQSKRTMDERPVCAAPVVRRSLGHLCGCVSAAIWGTERRKTMDFRIYYQKVRDVEAKIPGAYAVVVSNATPDGGKAGVATEVTRRVAAKMVVDGTATLSTNGEIKRSRRS